MVDNIIHHSKIMWIFLQLSTRRKIICNIFTLHHKRHLVSLCHIWVSVNFPLDAKHYSFSHTHNGPKMKPHSKTHTTIAACFLYPLSWAQNAPAAVTATPGLWQIMACYQDQREPRSLACPLTHNSWHTYAELTFFLMVPRPPVGILVLSAMIAY